MDAEDIGSSRHHVSARRTSWLAWLAAATVLLVAVGYVVVRPLAERAMDGASKALAMFASALGGVGAAVADVAEEARVRVEQSPEAQAVAGAPIRCAELEDVEWIGAQEALGFKFEFAGPRGSGVAHGFIVATEQGLQLEHLYVTGPNDEAVQLFEP